MSFVASLNASGFVSITGGIELGSASAAFMSGLNASGLIAGTIGEFLATAIAGSGVNTSGPSKITTLSATDVTASTFNGAPLTTGTSITVPSGLTTCALASIGGSMKVESGVALQGGLSVNATGVFTSELDSSGAITAASGITMLGSVGPHGYLFLISDPIETAGVSMTNQSIETTSLSFAIPSNSFNKVTVETDWILGASAGQSINIKLYIGTQSMLTAFKIGQGASTIASAVPGHLKFTASQTQSQIAKVTFQAGASATTNYAQAKSLRLYGIT